MNASYVRLPLSHIVPVEEPSARGLNMACGEDVKGQNYNIGTSQVGFEGAAELRGNRRETVKKHELRELTDEEMIRTYDELEREMHEIRSNLRKRGESSHTDAINAKRSQQGQEKGNGQTLLSNLRKR